MFEQTNPGAGEVETVYDTELFPKLGECIIWSRNSSYIYSTILKKSQAYALTALPLPLLTSVNEVALPKQTD